MPLKECSCIHPELEKLIREATNLLRKEKVSDKELADARAKSQELEKHLRGLEQLGVTVTPEMMAQVSSIATPKSVKLFEDLDKFIDSCKCPPDVDFDWQSFPYHEYGYKATTRRATGEACALSSEERENIEERLTQIANKYVYSLRDPVFLSKMKNKYGEQLITGSNVRHEVVTQGEVTKQEMDEFYELAHKLDEACGRKSGQTVRKYDTQLLQERIDLSLQREPREKHFGKKK